MSDTKESPFPKQVIICRHIEKDLKHKDYPGGSKEGLARANYLADLFLNPSPLFNRPDIIYAFNKKGGLLNRSYQAVAPLIKIGQYKVDQVNVQFTDDKEGTSQMIESMFSSTNEGKSIICVWEHSQIPLIIQQIGKRISPDKPVFQDFKEWSLKPWKGKEDDDLYSMVIVIDIASKSLIAFNQSNNFSVDRSVLLPEEGVPKILYKM